MATRKTTAAAQPEPAPIEPTSTEPVTLPELPPAETFVGLVAYGVDTTNDQSVHIPLEFVAQGAQAAVDAARAAHTATEHANAATTATQQATTAANTAAETANTAAADLEQLKTDCADATIATNTAAETANKQATAAHTAAASANAAAETANTKAGEAANAAESANAAATRANEAAQNITDDVSALVLTQANKPRIQELAGIDCELPPHVEFEVPGERWIDEETGLPKQVYIQRFTGTTPSTNTPESGYGFNTMTLINSTAASYVRGTISGEQLCSFLSSASVNFNNNLYWHYDSLAGLRVSGAGASILNPTGKMANNLGGKYYDLVFKYTK